MKKLFLLLTLFGVLCSSCTDSGDDVKNPQRPSPEESVFTISGDGSYVVGAEGGNVVVEVTTNLAYKVVIPEEVSWLTLAESRAVREESLTFIVEKNEELEERSVVVIVDAQGKELKSLNIKQEAEEPVFTTDSEGNYIIKAEGGDVVVNVTTNLEYDIVIPADASWVTIAESRAVREESLTFSVAKNEETSERIAKILLVDANAETLQEIIFIQEYDVEKVPLNQIWYTSIDGNKIEFNSDDYDEEYADPFNIFGANIVSHKYEDGEGVITFDNDVTKIGEDAFRKCTSLESIDIPNSVTEIGVNAFWYCTSLESIDIPNSVTEIGEGAFGYCSNLKEFKGKYVSEDGRCLIVNGVLNSFAPTGLTEYTIPDSVTEIGTSAFWYCTSLESITIPDSVVTIGDSAFYGCTSLEGITIPESVSEIGYAAFAACKSFDESGVYCKSTIPPTCSSDPFETFGFRIYVPKDSVDMYKDAPYWNSYSHCIVAYDYKNNCIYRLEASDIVKTWLGTYSAYTEEIIDIRERIVREQRTDFTFSVEPIDGADDQVYVYGLSVLGSDVPALGHVWTEAGVNYLAFHNQFTVAEFSYGYDPTWLPYCILSDGSYSFVTGDYYPMAFMMSADGTIQGLVRYGEVNDGRGYEVVAFDLVALDFNNGVFSYYYDEYNNPYTQWKHGVVKGITKVKSASVSRKSVDLNQFIVGGQLPCSVVVAQ